MNLISLWAARPIRKFRACDLPYDEQVIATTWWASAQDLERATQAAFAAAPAINSSTPADYYNYHRPHGALGGQTLRERLLAKTSAEVLQGS